MVISARWLFENHKKHLAMAKYYQELLDHPDNISAQASQNASDYGKALKEYLSYLLYFDLVQIILTDEEKWLVEHIFIKEETYSYLRIVIFRTYLVICTIYQKDSLSRIRDNSCKQG